MNTLKNLLRGFVLAAGLYEIGPAEAAIIYVDKDIGCPGSGTSAAPYCSIQNAVNVVKAGDTIRIRTAASPYSETIQTNKSGTATSPIIVEPDVSHNPILRNTGNGGGCATFWLHNADHWTIRNLNFDATGVTPCVWGAIIVHAASRDVSGHKILNNIFKGWGGPQAENPAAKGMAAVTISGGALGPTQGFWPSALIEGNTFDSNRLINIALAHTNNVVVKDNEFKGTKCGRDTDGAVNELGVKAIYNNKNLTVQGNIFHDFEPSSNCGINNQIYATYAAYWCDVGTSGPILVEGNRIYNIDQNKNNFSNPRGLDQSSTGIFVEAGCYQHTVRNNVIYDVGSMGLRNRQDNLDTTKRNKYYNNTIYSVAMFGIRVVNPGGVEVKNNILYNNGIRDMQFEGTAAKAGNHLVDYNLYHSTSGGSTIGAWGNGTGLNFNNWRAACGCDSHSLNSDPLLVSPTSNFGLRSSSPARGTAEGGADMGAYPYGSTPALPAPSGLLVIPPPY